MASYRFGVFTLDTGAYTLTRDGSQVPVTPRQLDLLAYLVTRSRASPRPRPGRLDGASPIDPIFRGFSYDPVFARVLRQLAVRAE